MSSIIWIRPTGLWLLVLLSLSEPLVAQFELQAYFTDHMVLQRDRPVVITGRDAPGQVVHVDLAELRAQTITASDGSWQLVLPAQPAGGPFRMEVRGSEEKVLQDVLFGDVWVCGGQSNMEHSFNQLQVNHELIARGGPEQLRFMTVDRAYSFTPQQDFVSAAGWRTATPEDIAAFSAVAYFFGADIHHSTGVPIGLVSSNWGGTRAEPWISKRSLGQVTDIRPEVDYSAQLQEGLDRIGDKVVSRDQLGVALRERLIAYDRDLCDPPWRAEAIDTAEWYPMKLATRWEDVLPEGFDGVGWFFKQVYVPGELVENDLLLNLGQIDDIDSTWFNGVGVGGMAHRNAHRSYRVPAGAVRAGWNTLVLRVVDVGGNGGFLTTGEDLFATPADYSTRLSLSGDWWVRPTVATDTLAATLGHERPTGQYAALFNAMIAPLTRLPVRGVIWYQGESNRGQPGSYADLMRTLIADWRDWWQDPNLPFFQVQLAAFGEPVVIPADSRWARIQEAQMQTGRSIPQAGTAVAIDVGDIHDIHPKDKQTVGERLARLARRQVYGEEIAAYGPVFTKFTVEGTEAILHFDHLEGGLTARGSEGRLYEFTIAGADRIFHPARAQIVDDRVVVSSELVDRPVAVRYAWADNPQRANLYNRAGLPSGPFRTDDWPLQP